MITTNNPKKSLQKKKPLSKEQLSIRAMRIIGIRPHSKYELASKLKKLCTEPSSIHHIPEIIQRIEDMGYIDEHALALRMAEYIITTKKKGIIYLIQRLKELRLSEENIKEAHLYGLELLDNAYVSYVESQLRRMPGGLTSLQVQKKIIERSLRRGFSRDLIQKHSTALLTHHHEL